MSRLIERQIDGFRLTGFSLAGEETVVIAPEFNVAFDVGRAPREIVSIDNVCLSHGHMDHAAGVAYYVSQRTFVGLKPGRVIVHRSLAQPVQELMDVWSDIEGHPSPAQVIGVLPLEDVELRRNLFVRPFDVNHCAGALGFTLIERRHKLKPEFSEKTGPELVELKRKGVAIDDNLEVPLLTYTGDTALGRFLDYSFVRQSRVVLIECTFFERDHRERAQAGRHIHVDDLPRVTAALPDSKIVLLHVTRRTDMRDVRRDVERVLAPADRERVTILMDRPPRPMRTSVAAPTDQA